MSTLNITARKFLRKTITETHNKRNTFKSLSEYDKLVLRKTVEGYSTQIKLYDERVRNEKFIATFEEKDFEAEFATCQSYELKLTECLTLLSPGTQDLSSHPKQNSLLKTPIAPLPKYSGSENEDLFKFLSEFEQTISRYSLPSYDKLILLKQQLSDRALVLVDNIKSDDKGYDEAVSLLKKSLGSEETQIFNTIKQLSQLKLGNDDDPYSFISQFSCLKNKVDKLNISIDNFLQYYFWVNLNENFKSHFTQVTNQTRPSLKILEDKYFDVCDRYLSKKKLKQSKESNTSALKEHTIGLAVKVGPKINSCTICSKSNKDSNHSTAKCSNFTDSKSKISQINYLGGCSRCALFNHSTANCRYKFRSKCNYCNGWHMSYLCSKGDNSKSNSNFDDFKSEKNFKSFDNTGSKSRSSTTDKIKQDKGKEIKKPKEQSETVSSNMVVCESVHSTTFNNAILPTFQFNIKGQRMRGLKDSGCQSNLITERLAKDLNLQVIKDSVLLTVKGINVPKSYKSKLVQGDFLIGNKNFRLQAYCLTDFGIDLNLDHLTDIASIFIDKGYTLADPDLLDSNKINDIQFMLGTESSYCLAENEIVFGANNRSVYSKTHAGILLKGNAERMFSDLNYLDSSNIDSDKDHVNVNSVLNSFNVNSSFNSDIHCLQSTIEDFNILNDQGEVVDSILEKATESMLEDYYNQNFIESIDNSVECHEINERLIKYVYENTSRDVDGRLVMPLMWHPKVSHLLGTNYYLSNAILKSFLNKLNNDKTKFDLVQEVFNSQEKLGIIERVQDLDEYLANNPQASFMPYMGVFRLSRESTKCRIVFLSNLVENKPNNQLTVSHNQAILPGPSLNQKLASSILHLRFDKYLLCFDLVRAFNQIGLSELDQSRLLFLWVDSEGNTICFKNRRLTFGLRCSPAILILGLFKILVTDSEDERTKLSNLKKLIYQLTYMDNCAISSNDTNYIAWAYDQLNSIFNPYKFEVQQFLTNEQNLSKVIHSNSENKTEAGPEPEPVSENKTETGPKPEPVKKLLGINWDQVNDTIFTDKLSLDLNANTKRKILSSFASNFDIFSFNGPLLNRARLFLHSLQCDQNLDWDQSLSDELLNEWRKVAKQVNQSPPIVIPRNVGGRKDTYRLIAFSDSSKLLYGCVIYILNLNSNNLSF